MEVLPDSKKLTYRAHGTLSRAPPRHKKSERFLKGPIPLPWLSRAAQLPGKSLHVSIAVWFLAGLTRNRTVQLSSRVSMTFGVDRHAKYRALRWLEEARLIKVIHRPGCSPRVTLLEVTGN
jgi:hypothetical protein